MYCRGRLFIVIITHEVVPPSNEEPFDNHRKSRHREAYKFQSLGETRILNLRGFLWDVVHERMRFRRKNGGRLV